MRKNIILILLFALAAFLITFHFTDTPKVWVDEGVFTETAKNLALHGVIGLQTAPGQFFSMRNFLLSTSYPVIFPVALSLKLFGVGIWQARLPMILYMFALVVLYYLFVRKKYGFYQAILSVLLLLSFSPFYGNGRPVQGEVPGLVFLVLGALFLLYMEESDFQSKKFAILSGLAFGLSASVKPVFLLGIVLSFVVVGLFSLRKIKNKKIIYFLGLGFMLPVFVYSLIHFPTFKTVQEFIPNVLYFAGNHGSSISLSRTIVTNLFRFFRESTPILFSFLFGVIILSFAFRFFKKGEKDFSVSEYIIFSFIVLNWAGYLAGTGWYRYFFPAHALLYLLFPAAILSLAAIFKRKFLRIVLFAMPIALVLFQFYFLVFLSDTSFVVQRTRNSELAAVLGAIPPTQKVLFYNTVEAAVFLKGDNYSQYLTMGFFDAGNKNILNSPGFDDILTDQAAGDSFSLSSRAACYDKKLVAGQYVLFQKTPACKD